MDDSDGFFDKVKVGQEFEKLIESGELTTHKLIYRIMNPLKDERVKIVKYKTVTKLFKG